MSPKVGPHTLVRGRGVRVEAGLTGTHLWLKGGSRRQSRRRDKLRNFDWLAGGGGLHLRQNHSRGDFCGSAATTHLLTSGPTCDL